MAAKIVRCPYCVDRNAFMPMIDCFGGRFVCAKCGHVVMQAINTFRCRCRHCSAQRESLAQW
jgi:DNA-directed RNA polymerase subunit RPC12/RpoP